MAAELRCPLPGRALLPGITLIVLLGVVRAAVATRVDWFTPDEIVNIVEGGSFAQTGDARALGAEPPLVERWLGAVLPSEWLPAASLSDAAPRIDADAAQAALFTRGEPDAVRGGVRAAMLVLNALLLGALGVALGRLLGTAAALGALSLVVLDPTVAAHLPVAMSDLPGASLGLTALCCSVLAFRSRAWGDWLLASAALGLSLGASHGALILAVALLLIAIGSALRSPLERRRLAWANVGVLLCGAALVPLVLYRSPVAYVSGLLERIAFTEAREAETLFFFGRSWKEPPWYFWPGVLAVKLPLGSLALSLAGLGLAVRGALGREQRLPLAVLSSWAALIAVLATIHGDPSRGVRRVLAVALVLAIWGGVALARAASATGSKRGARRGLACSSLAAVALSALPVARPWEYYNELVGRSDAFRYFNDQGVDHAQRGLELVRHYAKQRRPGRVYDFYGLSEEEVARRGLHFDAPERERVDSDLLEGTIYVAASELAPRRLYDYAALRAAEPEWRYGNLLVFRGAFQLPWLRASRKLDLALSALAAEPPDTLRAERLLGEIIEIYPEEFGAAIELGNLLLARGARTEAARAYALAHDHAPPGHPLIAPLRERLDALRRTPNADIEPVPSPWS
jgi:hypothetical protein